MAKRADDTRLRTKSGKYVAECDFCYCPEGCACDLMHPCGCGNPKPRCQLCGEPTDAGGSWCKTHKREFDREHAAWVASVKGTPEEGHHYEDDDTDFDGGRISDADGRL